MSQTFPVAWRKVFTSLSVYMTLAMAIPIIGIMVIRFFTTGFSLAETFRHMSATAFVLVLLGIPVLSVVVAFLIAQWFRLAAITIDDGHIQGRTFWGMKGRIPLSDITQLTPFHNNGINAIVVHSKYHGKIYISDQTSRLPELLEILASHLPADSTPHPASPHL